MSHVAPASIKKGLHRDYAFKFLCHMGKEEQDLLREALADDIYFENLLAEGLLRFEEIYSWDDAENPHEQLGEKEKELAISLIKDTLSNYESIRQRIEKQLAKRTFQKLDRIVAEILLLGVAELLYGKVDFKVVINEYILLAKKYGPQDSFTMINGVLDAIWRA